MAVKTPFCGTSSTIIDYIKYNFKKYKSINFYKYYDTEAVMALTIFESGWSGKYQCIEEWGEYGSTEQHLYTSEEISKIYGIKSFSRKEKLIKINESTL
jgi:hypothetical protein